MSRTNSLQFFSFRTRLGWIGILGQKNSLYSLSFGNSTKEVACQRLIQAIVEPPAEMDWNPSLRKRLTDYAEGAPVDFWEVDVAIGDQTPFSVSIIEACRRIPYGETRSYGDLARETGAPKAARAVGNVMKSNRCPLVVPCHRVVHGDGRIGQFSAPQGVSMKLRLLSMEAASSGFARGPALLVDARSR